MPEDFTPGRSRCVLVLSWLALYASFALLSPALLDDADSVHAEVAREMIQRHDPVTLYANGIRYLEKAPVLYWSMAGSMRAFGVGTTQARLPLALFALLLFLVTEAFARRAFGSARVGIYAAAGLLLSFGLFIFTRILIPDAIVCLWLTSAVFCFWLTEGDGEGRASLLPCLGFGAACAMNILTKGLIGLVFPIGTVLLYLIVTRGFVAAIQRLRQLHLAAATLVFLAVAVPWHVLAGLANPTEGHPAGLTHTGRAWIFWKGWQVGSPAVGSVHGWTWFYFMNEHLLRYLNLRVPRDYDTVPLLLFWGLVLVWMMPWSGFLFHAMVAAPWRALRSCPGTVRLSRESRTLLLLAIAGLLPLIFFSFSTRQEYYVLPSLPFFAILIARWLDREIAEAEAMTVPPVLTRAGQRISVVLLVGGTLAALGCVFFLLHTQAPSANVDLASLLQQNPGEYALSFGHFLDLNGPAMGAFRRPLVLTAVALFGSTLANWSFRRSFHPHQGNLALAAGTLVFLVAAHMGLTIFAPVLSSEKLARAIAPMVKPNNMICINDEYEAGSTLGFYLKRNDIHIWHGHSANLWYGSFFADAPPIFETDPSMRLRWLGPQRIFLWTDPAKLPALPGKAYVIAEGGGKQIVSNKAGDY
jgi:4-amino-4-deoxy-L-arabinose transferase-like glycosyltransferase